MQKVLIFGAGGFVGSYLSREFLNHGYVVYGSDKQQGFMLPEEVTFVHAELLDSDSIKKVVKEIEPDIIINLAAISSVGASWEIPQTTITVNVVGALNIMESARRLKKQPKVMFIGSSEEYVVTDRAINEKCSLDASNPYGISKVTQEQFAKLYRERYGMQVYYVRPFNHTGVGQRDTFVLPSWCKQVARIEKSGKSGVIKVGNLAVKRDFSHVKDIVRAYRMIVENENCEKVYNVGFGKAYPLEEILHYIISLSNQNIAIEVDKNRIRPTDQSVICCDHSLITSELGWKPAFTIFDALTEMYVDFIENQD